jgi:hypothetical protein
MGLSTAAMAHKMCFNTRQAVLMMEQLKKGFTDPGIERADKVELHGLHQQIQHSLAYEGRLDGDTEEIEPPIIRRQ